MAITAPRRLSTYTDPSGLRRELIIRSGARGSLLVIDRRWSTEPDERLLAHLHPDEPLENAAIVCHDYLARAPSGRRCRPVAATDDRSVPFDLPPVEPRGLPAGRAVSLVRDGICFELDPRPSRMLIPELRWTRRELSRGAVSRTISLREAIGEAQAYEPFRALTRQAVAQHRDDPSVSTTTLAAELERTESSAIVLNRGLREAVVQAMRRGEMSMSEIAMRCGRVKRDGRGNQSGETSWLARRVGLLPEGGGGAVTAWVHSDVLGLIARRGLGISPREVELG
ncbi:MAG: hypothetical protein ACYDC2_02735 [Solirubrobacteraceae bacterium]